MMVAPSRLPAANVPASSNSADGTGTGWIFASKRPDPAEERARQRKEEERQELRQFLEQQAKSGTKLSRRTGTSLEDVTQLQPQPQPADVNHQQQQPQQQPIAGRRARQQWSNPVQQQQPLEQSDVYAPAFSSSESLNRQPGTWQPQSQPPRPNPYSQPPQHVPPSGYDGGYPAAGAPPHPYMYYSGAPPPMPPPPPPGAPYHYTYPFPFPYPNYPLPAYTTAGHTSLPPPPPQASYPNAPAYPDPNAYQPPRSTRSPPPLTRPRPSSAQQTAPPPPTSVAALGASADDEALNKQRDRDRARQYQAELEAQMAAKRMRDAAEKAERKTVDVVAITGGKDGSVFANGAVAVADVPKFGRRRVIQDGFGQALALNPAAAAAAPSPSAGAANMDSVAHAVALANAALAKAGLPAMVVPPTSSSHPNSALALLPLFANNSGSNTNLLFGSSPSNPNLGPLGLSSTPGLLGSPPRPGASSPSPTTRTSHLRGQVDPTTLPEWQREALAKKHAEQLRAAAALKEQIEAKERAKAEQIAHERNEEAREVARLEAERKELEERHRREREEEVERKRAEEEEKSKKQKAKRDEMEKSGGKAAEERMRAKAEEEAMKRKNKHVARRGRGGEDTEEDEEPASRQPPPPAVPFRSLSPPIPTVQKLIAKTGGIPIQPDNQIPTSPAAAAPAPITEPFRTSSPPLPAQAAATAAAAAGGATPGPKPPVVVLERGVARAPSATIRRRPSSALQQQQMQPQQGQPPMQASNASTPSVFDRLQDLRRELMMEQQRVGKDLNGAGAVKAMPGSPVPVAAAPAPVLSSSLGLIQSESRFVAVPSDPRPPAMDSAPPRVTFQAGPRPSSRGSSLNLDALERVNAARLQRLKALENADAQASNDALLADFLLSK